MATIIPFPDIASAALPYAEVRANAENLNTPWQTEFNQKQVKYCDLINGMLGTQNVPFTRVRDDSGSLVLSTSRFHDANLFGNIDNATEISLDGVTEFSENGWETPVFSRAVNEFASAAAVIATMDAAIAGLDGIEVEVNNVLDRWNNENGPTVIKPVTDALDSVDVGVLRSNTIIANFYQDDPANPGTSIPVDNPERVVNGILQTKSRRDFTGTTFVRSNISPISDFIVNTSVQAQLATFNLALDDGQVTAGNITQNVYFDNSSGIVQFDDIQFSPRASLTGSGTAICPLIILNFIPRTGGVVQEGAGGFQIRLFRAQFKNAADADHYQIGSLIKSSGGISWFPRGS